ncbi:HERC2 [Symbiodinium natans]|uniref:HERC2 protein n=1 Tax=Symbiodinium natans TaxID=878477 RepID=A0A812H8X0_9DINO|nr:HERC2 [Symbiodinium natans]
MTELHCVLLGGRVLDITVDETCYVWQLKERLQEELGWWPECIFNGETLRDNDSTLCQQGIGTRTEGVDVVQVIRSATQNHMCSSQRHEGYYGIFNGECFWLGASVENGLEMKFLECVGAVRRVEVGNFGDAVPRAEMVLLGQDGSVRTFYPSLDVEVHAPAAIAELRDVEKVVATERALAAVRADGSVAAWGEASDGGELGRDLLDVREVVASVAAFAAIHQDGRVTSWGDPDFGGDCQAVSHRLRNVQDVAAAVGAFAAISRDGSVVTWGDQRMGGDSAPVQQALQSVVRVYACFTAFAALLADGRVVTWGSADGGGDSSMVQAQLQDVKDIAASQQAFAALRSDGSVVTWGRGDLGGDSRAVQDQLRDVQKLVATQGSFCALLQGGRVVTWGRPDFGGDSSDVQDRLRHVRDIHADMFTFCATLSNGELLVWGSWRLYGKVRFLVNPREELASFRDFDYLPPPSLECRAPNVWTDSRSANSAQDFEHFGSRDPSTDPSGSPRSGGLEDAWDSD